VATVVRELIRYRQAILCRHVGASAIAEGVAASNLSRRGLYEQPTEPMASSDRSHTHSSLSRGSAMNACGLIECSPQTSSEVDRAFALVALDPFLSLATDTRVDGNLCLGSSPVASPAIT
jgi:hypothetical protein